MLVHPGVSLFMVDPKTPRVPVQVEAGSLGISVAVFAVCACICLATLYFRRVTYGGELGGPRRPARLTAALFTGLWFVYLLVSALVEYSKPE